MRRRPAPIAVALLAALCATATASAAADDSSRRRLQPTEMLPQGYLFSSAAWGDFDADGKVDVAAGIDYGNFNIALNRGEGVFEPVGRGNLPSTGSFSTTARLEFAGDQNRDGALDLVWREGSRVLVAFGAGAGAFTLPVLTQVLPSGRLFRALDIDGDSRIDFVDLDENAKAVRVHLGGDSGAFPERATIPLNKTLPWQEGLLIVADLDGDGDADILAGNQTCCPARLAAYFYWNEGGLRFTETAWPGLVYMSPFVGAGDVDGDGAAEIVAASVGLLDVADLVDRAVVRTQVPVPALVAGGAPFAVSDLDGDGRPDVLLASTGRVFVVWGPDGGMGAAGAAGPEVSSWALPGSLRTPALVDVDADGRLDIAARDGSEGLAVLTHTERPRRLRGAPVSAGVSWARGAAADLSGDALPDLVLARPGEDGMKILVALGDGRFAPAGEVAGTLGRARTPVLADVDGDGFVDLTVQDAGAAAGARVLFGNGGASLGPAKLALGALEVVASAHLAGSAGDALVARTESAIQLVLVSRDRAASASPVADVGGDDRVFSVDADGDGVSELLVAPPAGGGRVLRHGAGGWEPYASLPATGSALVGVVAITGRSAGERYLVAWDEGSYRVFPVQSGELVMTSGGGGAGGPLTSLDAADVDRDGLTDIVYGNARNSGQPSLVFVARSLGDGTFEPYDVALAGPLAAAVIAFDADRDGWPDAVVASNTGIETLLNAAAPPRVRAVAIPAAPGPVGRVRLVANLLPATASAVGVLTVRWRDQLVHREQPVTWYDHATVIWEPPRLPIGEHVFSLEYEDYYAGASERAVRVDVRPSPPRRRTLRATPP